MLQYSKDIDDIHLFLRQARGACNPQVEQYILGPYNINSINLLWSKNLANNIHSGAKGKNT